MDDIVGNVTAPPALQRFLPFAGVGLGTLINLFLNILVVAGTVYALFNFILAGYSFLGAGNDPKKVEGAWAKIWQTVIGLAFIAGATVLGAIFGQLLFGDWRAIIEPTIPGL